MKEEEKSLRLFYFILCQVNAIKLFTLLMNKLQCLKKKI